ncbi:hypothetical protein OHT57_22100 [Streptomyces sp. NBC_00285]|uniref:hypothetical protein n=1 Tax=Streptomyces sp. NBC_00285 TaxID=2975700 RepID=UPI002E2D8590|nr:hypothetical protein [Streptomyces sp. NBC_00285]
MAACQADRTSRSAQVKGTRSDHQEKEPARDGEACEHGEYSGPEEYRRGRSGIRFEAPLTQYERSAAGEQAHEPNYHVRQVSDLLLFSRNFPSGAVGFKMNLECSYQMTCGQECPLMPHN